MPHWFIEKQFTVPEKYGKNSGSSGDSGLRGVAVALDQMTHQSKVKVGPEGETHTVIQRLKVPLQRLARRQHDRLQRLCLEGVLTVQLLEVLLEQGQTAGVQRDLIQLEDGNGHPEERLVDRRLGTQQRLQPRQTHDNRVNEGDVVKALQGFDENAQQLFDVLVSHGF